MMDDYIMPTLLVHAAATLAMTGLIWFVQVVHYPLMAKVGAEGYSLYQHTHMSRTTWVVAPLMLTELSTAALLIPMLGPASYPITISGLVMLSVVYTESFYLLPTLIKPLVNMFAWYNVRYVYKHYFITLYSRRSNILFY